MIRLTGERKAIAAAMLALYGFLFLLVTLNSPPGWEKVFGGLSLAYWVGFFSVVSGYFWARWYALGLGMSGLVSAGISMFQMGPEPVLMFYGGTHALIAGMLWGNQMSKPFDGRIEWRKRFHLDEPATDKLGKAITRLGMSLPYVIMYALSPKEGAASMLAMGALGFAVMGAVGILRQRTWGLFSVGLAAVTTLVAVSTAPVSLGLFGFGDGASQLNAGVLLYAVTVAAPILAGLFLSAAIAPFAKPIWRAIRSDSATF